MFDILGHNFSEYEKYGRHSSHYFICLKCKIVIFKTDDGTCFINNSWRGPEFWGVDNIRLNLTCSEVIIKNIIE